MGLKLCASLLARRRTGRGGGGTFVPISNSCFTAFAPNVGWHLRRQRAELGDITGEALVEFRHPYGARCGRLADGLLALSRSL